MKNYLIIIELRKNFGKFEDDSKIGSWTRDEKRSLSLLEYLTRR